MNQVPPNAIEKLALIRAHLRIGLLVNFGEYAFAAIEALSAERYQALQKSFNLSVLLSRQRAIDLGLSWDPSRDFALKLPQDYRFGALKALADPSMDLDYPGKGPLAPAEVDFENAISMLQICRSAQLLPAVIFIKARQEGSAELTPELATALKNSAPKLERLAHARVPLKRAAASQLHVFRNLADDGEHSAVVVGGGISDNPLVRLHSACFTGDCLGSLKCDCGPQLDFALEALNREGGVLVYLSQEGRGIGLPNKIRAYHLQDQGYDTVEANLRLGFQDDERDFRIGSEILKLLKINRLRLMTNNPRKVTWLENAGIEVTERVPVKVGVGDDNRDYLMTKAKKSGHLL